MKEKIKELWKLCFPEDSDEFVELYFSSRYTDDITSVIDIDGEIASALQRIPYPMTYKGHTIPVSYISGACTHPSRRSIGLMTKLLSEAHSKMYNDGILLSTLIPANESLVGFYSKSQYIVGSREKKEVFSYDESFQHNNMSFLKFEFQEKDIYDIYSFIYKQQSKKSSCILHSIEDMKVIISDHKLSGGEIWIAYNYAGDIYSIAFVINEDNNLLIKEIVSLNKNAEKGTINFLFKYYNKESAYKPYPCGMIRIINTLEILKLYAQQNNMEYLIEVYGDDTISENNGLYLLSGGTCLKLKKELQKEIPNIKYIKLNISELADFLFKDEEPYINLMLN